MKRYMELVTKQGLVLHERGRRPSARVEQSKVHDFTRHIAACCCAGLLRALLDHCGCKQHQIGLDAHVFGLCGMESEGFGDARQRLDGMRAYIDDGGVVD